MTPMGYVFIRRPSLPLPKDEKHTAYINRLVASVIEQRYDFGSEVAFVTAAIRVSSPDLFQAITTLSSTANNKSHSASSCEKVALSLRRYITRMVFRPTPFSLFSVTSTGSIADTTAFNFQPPKVVARPSGRFIARKASALKSVPEIKASMEYGVNTTALINSNYITFSDATSNVQYARLDDLSKTILDILSVEPMKFGDMKTLNTFQCFDSEAVKDAFISLIGFDILRPMVFVSPFHHSPKLPVLGRSAAIQHDQALLQIQKMQANAVHSVEKLLSSRKLDIQELDKFAFEDHYFELSDEGQSSIAATDVESIISCAQDYSNCFIQKNPSYACMITAYLERFAGSYVPIMRFIDSVHGVGEAMSFERTKEHDASRSREALCVDRAVMSRCSMLRGLIEGCALDLSALVKANDQTQFENVRWGSLNVTPMAKIGHSGQASFILNGVVLGSGNEFIARLCDNESEFSERIATCIRATCPIDEVAVDVVLSGDKDSRIYLARPFLTEHYLWVDGVSGTPGQISLNDVFVTCDGIRFRLYSKSLNRFLALSINTAYNPSATSNSNLYWFLALCASPYHIGYSPADLLFELPYIPRMTWQDLVVAPATWRFTEFDRQKLHVKNPSDLVRTLQAILRERGLEFEFSVGTLDMFLDVDANDELSILAALSSLKDERSICRERIVSNTEGRDGVVHSKTEVIIPFYNRRRDELKAPLQTRALSSQFVTGGLKAGEASSEAKQPYRLYYKLYPASYTKDEVLERLVAEFAEAISELIYGWYFVQYRDPEFHFRVRFLCKSAEGRIAVDIGLSDLLQTEYAEGLLRTWVKTTYEPEYWKFGGVHHLANSEAIFCYESKVALRVRELCRSSLTDDPTSTILAVHGLYVSFIIESLGFDLFSKDEIKSLRQSLKSFAFMPGKGSRLEQERLIVDNVMRLRNKVLSANLDSNDVDAVLASSFSPINAVTNQIRRIVDTIETFEGKREYILHVIHLSANRLHTDWSEDLEKSAIIIAYRCREISHFGPCALSGHGFTVGLGDERHEAVGVDFDRI